MVRLKDICDVDWGDTNLTKQSYVENGKYLGVSAGGCDGRMEYYDFNAYVPVISAIGANCGKMFLPKEPFVAIKNTITLNPHTNVLGKYIYYALIDNHIPRRGGGQPFISKSDTEEYLINCPPFVEQQKIVEKFDNIENLISLRKQQLSKLDELVKSRFIEMLSNKDFPKTALIDLIVEGAGLSYGIVQPGDDGTGEMGVLRPVDIVDGNISIAGIKYIDRSIGDGYRKTELTGDELIITVRGTTGITALTDARFVGMNVTRGIAVIRYDRRKINPVYLNAYLKTEDSQRYIQEHTRGATLQQINLSDLRMQNIVVPPMELQNQMAAFVKQIDKSKFEIQKSLEKLETLKKALMQKYFG